MRACYSFYEMLAWIGSGILIGAVLVIVGAVLSIVRIALAKAWEWRP